MQIEVTTRHGELSDASREKIISKVDKLRRYFDRLTSIEIIVDLKDESSPTVEIIASAERRDDFVARAAMDSMWGGVDSAVQKMEQQLRKYKEKLHERHRHNDSRRQPAEDTELELPGD